MRSRAIYSNDTTSYVKVNEIYNDTTGAFDANNVNALLKYITGNSSITYENASSTLNTLATNKTTSADIRSKSVTVNGVTKSSSQDVIVRFGGLDWTVTYLSKDEDDNNILTLWLSTSKQNAFAGRTSTEGAYYGFINNSLYSDWSVDWHDENIDSYPSNMYGTSYIRAVTLNNGGQYATSASALSSAYAQNSNSVFARFTMEEVENSLTQYITIPSKVSWQAYQSTAATNSDQDYYLSNDSIEDPADENLAGKWYSSSYNYKDKDGYKDWANDYLWLPSIAETGYNTSNIGLWETSTEQRQNISSSNSEITPGVGSSNSNYGTYVCNYSWLRSGGYYNASSALAHYPSGGVAAYLNVRLSNAVRPALHLNLNAVLDSFEFAKVGELYDDEAGEMSEENVNVLLKYITGQADVNVDNASEVLGSLASATRSSEDFRANAVSATGANKQAGQEIKITFGGLDWWAVYLSKANGTGDNILTLWLDESQQDAWADRPADEGELYGFINGSLYSDWSNDRASNNYSSSYPDNMYGRSYIRSITLNNGGEYSTSGSAKTTATQNENSVFARFTMEGVEGSLTQYITTPSKMSWQTYQSSAATNPSLSYYYPNDSIEDPVDKNLAGSWQYSYMNYENKDGYKDWANDYIWLPSLAEAGYDTSNIGLWETSTEQRKNFSSSLNNNGTVGSANVKELGAYNYSWLRSGRSNVAYIAYSLYPSGGGEPRLCLCQPFSCRPSCASPKFIKGD